MQGWAQGRWTQMLWGCWGISEKGAQTLYLFCARVCTHIVSHPSGMMVWETLNFMNLGTLRSQSWIISPSEINLVLGQPLVSCELDSQNLKLTLAVLQHYDFFFINHILILDYIDWLIPCWEIENISHELVILHCIKMKLEHWLVVFPC